MRPITDFEVTAYKNVAVKYTVSARTPEEAESIVETLTDEDGTIVESTIDSMDTVPVEEVV